MGVILRTVSSKNNYLFSIVRSPYSVQQIRLTLLLSIRRLTERH